MDRRGIYEENLGHHSFVFMLQKVAVKHRNAADDWVSEIHDHVHGAARFHVNGVEPLGGMEHHTVLRIHLEVNLVDVKRVDLVTAIYHGPVMIGAYRNSNHGRRVRLIFFVVDVEAVLVLGEYHGEVWSTLLQSRKLRGGDWTIDRRAGHGLQSRGLSCSQSIGEVGQHHGRIGIAGGPGAHTTAAER